EDIHIYIIPNQPLSEILQNKHHSTFSINISDTYIGHLMVDTSPNSMLGIGAFKMALPERVMFTPPPETGLGSHTRHDVVVK
ncbi:hypothetical protein PAXRUDRAFT_180686, partial [Paxillus rubicundulus Ve08.2h10]